ncbi:hypothetical protein [Nocardia heshunensis]
MAYTRNDGGGSVPGQVAGRVTGFLLIAVAVLTFAMFWLPITTYQMRSGTFEEYVWKTSMHGGGIRLADCIYAVPYVLMMVVAGVVGILLAVGMGTRRGVLFWAAAFGGGLTWEYASGDVAGAAHSFALDESPGAGFWVMTLIAVVAIAALVTGLRSAAVSKRVAAQAPGGMAGGGAADRAAGVFLILATLFNLGSSCYALARSDQFTTVWRTEDGTVPWNGALLGLESIAVLALAIALLAGAGVRNPAVRAASGAAAALIVANAIGGLSVSFGLMGLNFWEYAGKGFWLTLPTLLLAFAATIAGLVAQLARPGLTAQPRAGYAPGFAPAPRANPFAPVGQPVASGPNPFAAAAAAPNPFAPSAPAPNPFAQPTPAPNPFVSGPNPMVQNPFAPAQGGPGVEATVRIDPEPARVQPPRMAKVYDGKDDQGRPVVNRPELEGNSRVAVLAYLESAPIVLAARSFDQDEFTPADRDVPLTFRTDGVWVWAGAVSHYLNKHGLTPEPELVQHIVSRGFRVGDVDEAAKDAAIKVITGG